ncbi:MAG: hypothetical protein ACM3OO_02465 [Planctomycetaceae bacterium]
MRLTWRDALATVFVVAAALVYALWLAEVEVFGLSSPRAVGIVVMVLGLAASVTAVVYGVGAGLLKASKVYLAVTSVIGLVALIAGIAVLANEDETMLATLVIATAVLWLMATVRHVLIAGDRVAEPTGPPAFGHAA